MIRVTAGFEVPAGNLDTDVRFIRLKAGEIVLIAGPNGVGKSALMDEIYGAVKSVADRLTGFRQIHFQSADIDDVGFSLEDLLRNLGDRRSFSRYRNHWSEQHLESYMRRLKDSELQALADTVSAQHNGAALAEATERYLNRAGSVGGSNSQVG